MWMGRVVRSVLFWAAAGGTLYLLRFGGLPQAPQMRAVDFSGVDFTRAAWMMIGGGGMFGLGTALVAPFLASKRVRRLPYGRVILVNAAVVVLVLLSVTLGVFSVVLVHNGTFTVDQLVSRMANPSFLVVLGWVAGMALLESFVSEVDRKVGPGNLLKILLGRYYRPRAERRVFMFLDLQGSTTHAERLGHIRYSELIQDCFRDLAVVIEDGAEVYQYVGDEAVLSWPEKKGLKGEACLNAYFRFSDQITANRAAYESKYGIVPVFKAGVNHGEVTAVEVGEIKREIAFHGDVLNTAARIQGKCNEYGRRLLISQELREALGSSSRYHFESLGSLELRGRTAQVGVFAVERGPA